MDIRRLGLCNERDKRKCLEEVGEGQIEWTCENCPKVKQGDLDEYTVKMLQIRRLKTAGYHIGNNDLTPDEWMDLATVEEIMAWPTKTPSQSS